MRVLVLGASGMLGGAVFRQFDGHGAYEAWGLVRNSGMLPYFSGIQQGRLVTGVDVLDEAALSAVFSRIDPGAVINCVGLIKQKEHANDPLAALPINAMLPHRLSALCAANGARLVHISSDCVFSGRKGLYTEEDLSDAEDLYGKSKHLGEVCGATHAVTLRTSIIGHELNSNHALVDWFLTQQGVVRGFTGSIFSGLTAIELARVICEVVMPNPALYGLYHVSSSPISKFDLLKLVAAQYGKGIEVLPDHELTIDRSLDSSRFRQATGYMPPSWEAMVRLMHESRK